MCRSTLSPGSEEVDEDFLESREFLAYMGCDEDDELELSA